MGNRVQRVITVLETEIEQAIRYMGLEVTDKLVEVTPVDTGWARINWIPSITEAVEETAGSRAAAEGGNLDSGPQETGLAEISSYNLEQGDAFVRNNVPYIQRLNAGSSAQAPTGFVEIAIDEVIAEAESRFGR